MKPVSTCYSHSLQRPTLQAAVSPVVYSLPGTYLDQLCLFCILFISFCCISGKLTYRNVLCAVFYPHRNGEKSPESSGAESDGSDKLAPGSERKNSSSSLFTTPLPFPFDYEQKKLLAMKGKRGTVSFSLLISQSTGSRGCPLFLTVPAQNKCFCITFRLLCLFYL